MGLIEDRISVIVCFCCVLPFCYCVFTSYEVLIHLLALQQSSSRSLACYMFVLQTSALASYEDDDIDRVVVMVIWYFYCLFASFSLDDMV
jgi:hypothetical protein